MRIRSVYPVKSFLRAVRWRLFLVALFSFVLSVFCLKGVFAATIWNFTAGTTTAGNYSIYLEGADLSSHAGLFFDSFTMSVKNASAQTCTFTPNLRSMENDASCNGLIFGDTVEISYGDEVIEVFSAGEQKSIVFDFPDDLEVLDDKCYVFELYSDCSAQLVRSNTDSDPYVKTYSTAYEIGQTVSSVYAETCGNDYCGVDEGWSSCPEDCVELDADMTIGSDGSLVLDWAATVAGDNAGFSSVMVRFYNSDTSFFETLLDGIYYAPGLPSTLAGSYDLGYYVPGTYQFRLLPYNSTDLMTTYIDFVTVEDYAYGSETKIVFPEPDDTYSIATIEGDGFQSWNFQVTSDASYVTGYDDWVLSWSVATVGGELCSGNDMYDQYQSFKGHLGGIVNFNTRCGPFTSADYGDYELEAQIVYTGVATLAADSVSFSIGATDIYVNESACGKDGIFWRFMCLLQEAFEFMFYPSATAKSNFLDVMKRDYSGVSFLSTVNAIARIDYDSSWSPSTVAGSINGLEVPSPDDMGSTVFRQYLIDEDSFIEGSVVTLIYLFGLFVSIFAILSVFGLTVRR